MKPNLLRERLVGSEHGVGLRIFIQQLAVCPVVLNLQKDAHTHIHHLKNHTFSPLIIATKKAQLLRYRVLIQLTFSKAHLSCVSSAYLLMKPSSLSGMIVLR